MIKGTKVGMVFLGSRDSRELKEIMEREDHLATGSTVFVRSFNVCWYLM